MGTSLKILVVDDHEDTLYFLSRLLRADGHQVETASSANEAMALAAAQPFNVVMTDIGLPDLTGRELMHELRRRHGLVGVALTGSAPRDDGDDDLFIAHLLKPIEFSELKNILKRLCH